VASSRAVCLSVTSSLAAVKAACSSSLSSASALSKAV
jgi:hypothetical protein